MARQKAPAPIHAVENPPVEISPDDLELADLVRRYPEATRVSVMRMNTSTDRWSHLGTVPSDIFSEDMIQKRWGGGLFQARFRNSKGHIIHSTPPLEIEEDPDRPPMADRNFKGSFMRGDGSQAVHPEPATDNTFMGVVLSELKSNREMMLEMIRSFSERPAAPPNDLVQMVTALSAMQGLLPKQSTPLPERIIEKLFEGALSGKGGGGGAAAPQNEWVGLLKDVIVEFKPAIRAALIEKGVTQPARPNRPALASAPPPSEVIDAEAEGDDDGEETVDATSQAVGWLKVQCSKGAKPAALVPVVLSFVDETQIDLLLAKKNEAIFLDINDPDLDEPSTRAWFEALFMELRAVRNISDPGRAGGNPANADANVGTGA